MRGLILTCSFLLSLASGAQKGGRTALVHVQVVDVEKGLIQKDQTVLIENGRIAEIFPATNTRKLNGYEIIEAKEKYLIPGLIDSHVHLHSYFKENRQSLLKVPFNVFLYYGVTGFREASGSTFTKEFVGIRDSIAAGKLLAPAMYVSGIATSTNLKKLAASSYTDLVSRFVEMKVDGIKVKFTTLEETKEIIDAAHRLKLPVYGHTANVWKNDSVNVLGDFTSPIVDYGIDGVMHTGGYPPIRNSAVPGPPPPEQWEAVWLYMDALWLFANTEMEESLISKMVKQNTWVEPTLTVEQLIFSRKQYEKNPAMKFTFSSYREYFTGYPELSSSQMDTAILVFKRKLSFVKKFHNAGGMVLAGTDHLFGSSLHKELELLVEAGLSPAEALKAATYNNAKALGWLENLGTVTVGKLASLVLLDNNPLKTISNTQSINTVIVRGQVLDRKKLDQLRKEAEAMVQKSPMIKSETGK